MIFFLGIASCDSCFTDITPTQEQISDTTHSTKSPPTSPITDPTIASLPVMPTLVLDERKELLLYLLQTNNNCQLPCWWGISIGETKIRDSLEIFSKLTEEISSNYPSPLTDGTTTVKILLTELNDFKGLIKQDLIVNEEIITTIRISFDSVSDSLVHPFQPDYIFSTLGEPNEVWIQSYYSTPEGKFPVKISLIYLDKGIVFFYGLDGKLVEDSIEACFDTQNSFLIGLSNNVYELEFPEVMLKLLFIPVSASEEFYDLETATSLSVTHFIELFNDKKKDVCIRTLRELW
jgi:hypothetical protein